MLKQKVTILLVHQIDMSYVFPVSENGHHFRDLETPFSPFRISGEDSSVNEWLFLPLSLEPFTCVLQRYLAVHLVGNHITQLNGEAVLLHHPIFS